MEKSRIRDPEKHHGSATLQSINLQFLDPFPPLSFQNFYQETKQDRKNINILVPKYYFEIRYGT
jgi:hypothetical protein